MPLLTLQIKRVRLNSSLERYGNRTFVIIAIFLIFFLFGVIQTLQFVRDQVADIRFDL